MLTRSRGHDHYDILCLGPSKVADAHAVVGAAGGEVMRKWLRRVSGEHATLSGSLPLAWSSSIFLAADPSRLDLLRSAAFCCRPVAFHSCPLLLPICL